MGRHATRFFLTPRSLLGLLVIAATLCSFSRLAAAATPESEHLVYSIMLGGLHVGDSLVTFDQTDQGYSASLDMMASGALRFVKDFRAAMRSDGTFADTAHPSLYKRSWTAGEIGEVMTMTFDPATRMATTHDQVFNPVTGAQLTHEDLPWNGHHAKYKPVPEDLRTNVLDPMGAFVAGREQLRAKLASGAPVTFRVPVYDGTRRYDIVGKADAPRPVSINGVERSLLPVTGHIEPLFGFTHEGEERTRNVEGKIYFTPDAHFIPVQIIASGELFSSVMNLVADCSEDAAPCAALSKTLAEHPVEAPLEQHAQTN